MVIVTIDYREKLQRNFPFFFFFWSLKYIYTTSPPPRYSIRNFIFFFATFISQNHDETSRTVRARGSRGHPSPTISVYLTCTWPTLPDDEFRTVYGSAIRSAFRKFVFEKINEVAEGKNVEGIRDSTKAIYRYTEIVIL